MLKWSSGSSRRNARTSRTLSRATTAVSSPWSEWVEVTASPKRSFRRSRASLDMRPSGVLPRRSAGGLVGGVGDDPELVVPLLVLDLVLKEHEPVEHLLGARRASGDVDVDRDDLVGAGHRVVVLVEAAGAGADAERDDPLRLRHL